MKRMICFLISAAVTLLLLLSCVPAASLSAGPESNEITSFEHVRCRISNDTVYLTSDYDNNDILISTDDKFDFSAGDREYAFRPEGSGEYVLTVFVTISIPNVTFGMDWMLYSFYIVSENGKITVRSEDIYCLHQDMNTVSLTPAAGEPLSYYVEDNDTLVGELYLICSQLKDNDHIFIYNYSDHDPAISCAALLIKGDKDNEIWMKTENGIRPVGRSYQLPLSTVNYPVIPGTVPPEKVVLIGLWHDLDEKEKIFEFIKCDGKRTLLYSINEFEDESLDPSSFTITEYPDHDLNADGEFNIADAVLLSKWLLGDASPLIVNWRSADLTADDILDTFDLCLMKEKLVAG